MVFHFEEGAGFCKEEFWDSSSGTWLCKIFGEDIVNKIVSKTNRVFYLFDRRKGAIHTFKTRKDPENHGRRDVYIYFNDLINE